MNVINFRTLKPDEIELRVGFMKDNGYTLLMYKDARVDMKLLDEVVGALNWKREHKLIGQQLFCTISIWNEETKEWVSKEDVGTESNTEAEKGRASDSFKRAGFNWGIGRELYTSPFVWINDPRDKNKTYDDRKNKKFKVAEIEYNEFREIVKLVIVEDSFNEERVVYSYPKNFSQSNTSKNAKPIQGTRIDEKMASTKQIDSIITAYRALQIDDNIFKKMLKDKLNITTLHKLTYENYTKIEKLLEEKANDILNANGFMN